LIGIYGFDRGRIYFSPKGNRLVSKGSTPTVSNGNAAALHSSAPALSGIWVTIAAITMGFAAFTSSLIIRQASDDWRHLALPGILYLNTMILLASSFTVEVARRKESRELASTRAWLYLTLGLGVAFLAGQVFAWHQLRVQGLYLATSPNSSFFYVLTVLHALHILGGLFGFVYAIRRTAAVAVWKVATLDAAAIYWHFLAGLWIYLLLLLRTRL
jgi:cytochrome c oxidase subunit 3